MNIQPYTQRATGLISIIRDAGTISINALSSLSCQNRVELQETMEQLLRHGVVEKGAGQKKTYSLVKG